MHFGGKGSNQFKAAKKKKNNENTLRSFSPFYLVINIQAVSPEHTPEGPNKPYHQEKESILLTTLH